MAAVALRSYLSVSWLNSQDEVSSVLFKVPFLKLLAEAEQAPAHQKGEGHALTWPLECLCAVVFESSSPQLDGDLEATSD